MEDLTGLKFNKWTVLKKVPNPGYKNKQTYWLCECSCDKHTQKVIGKQELKKGKSKSCGCLKSLKSSEMMKDKWQDEEFRNKHITSMTNNNPSKEKSIEGKKFGEWTVIERISEKREDIYYKCRCSCGTIKNVRKNTLINGTSSSCGCKKSSKGCKKIANLLNNNSIIFECEKTFENCRFSDTNRLAKFDFYVDNSYLIEFDGEQHFNCRSSGWNTEEHLIDTQRRDEFKNNWCKQNNIQLIRIPYTHYDELCLEDLLLETSKFII